MTFILGMKCADGLVLCADTLETDGVTKSYRVKLASLLWDDGNSEWGICWGASGHAFVCDKFKDKMRQTFKDQPYNRAAIEDRIEVCLEFVRQSYTAQDGIAVVIGLFGRTSDKGVIPQQWERFLYRGSSASACISPVRDYCFAGMDVTLAQFFLSNTYHILMPTEHGKRLGVFVTNLIKRHADGVGRNRLLVSHCGDR